VGQRVFDTVFPDLANALASGDPKSVQPPTREYLDEVREAALMLLYRLLFVLYAEDRGLLPVRDARYFNYTAHDLEPFARDLGYDGSPFMWDEDDRRHRRARLDALFFHLYGLSRDDAAYILDTFPIVREDDEKVFSRYLTKDLVLAYMNAIAAGDLSTVVKV
jgi:hypothetical protein